MASLSLRSKEHKIYGSSSPFPNSVLPTESDVFKRVMLSKEKLEIERGKKKIMKKVFFTPVIQELIEIWQKASIPCISTRGIEKKLDKLYEEGRNLMKNPLDSSPEFEKFQTQKALLFDISTCKCPRVSCDSVKCQDTACIDIHIQCQCLVKIPKEELLFLFDQRGPREMCIGGIDRKKMSSLKKIEERVEAEKEREEREKL